jgi:hypothetical protein
MCCVGVLIHKTLGKGQCFVFQGQLDIVKIFTLARKILDEKRLSYNDITRD